MSIAVTGATGRFGRHVVQRLLEKVPADRITAVVRAPEKAADLAARGVRIEVADYNAPETFGDLFSAGDKVLLISGNEFGKDRVQQHKVVIDAAKAADVALLAYTSALGSLTSVLVEDHRNTEQLLLESGLPYVLLRNSWYSEVFTENLAPALERNAQLLLESGLPYVLLRNRGYSHSVTENLALVLPHNAVTHAAGEGGISTAARADYADAAVAVLTGQGHENKTYELGGDVAWSYDTYAAELSRKTGKEIANNPVSAVDYVGILTGAGLAGPAAQMLARVDAAIEKGELLADSGDLSRLIGRPTTPLAESISVALKG